MKSFPTGRVLVLLLVLVVVFTAFAAVAASVYTVGGQTRDLGAAVALFAVRYERMPASIDDLVQAGYAQPTGEAGLYQLLGGPQGEAFGKAVPIDRFEVAWGVQPEQLVERDKGVFWRDTPEKRVLLVRHTAPPWVVRVLRGRMAMAFPVDLYRQLSGQALAQSQPATNSR
jgi:hypothetical protein